MAATMVPVELRRPAAPRSTVEKFSRTFLPPSVHRFLFSQSQELVVSHLLLRAACGAASGAVFYLCVFSNLPPLANVRLLTGLVFVAGFLVGGALSSSFRCSVLLMFPSMLGSRGQAYLTLFILSTLHKGPVSNMRRNVEAAALSLSCNLDLQVNNSVLLWREAVRPLELVTKELEKSKAELESELRNVSGQFEALRDEVGLRFGHEGLRREPDPSSNDTQQQFSAKTRMQCDRVVEEGVKRCADWFRLRWRQCMDLVTFPVLNHVLCVSMKFDFLCDVVKVMSPWCRDEIPVEGNFGRLFDRVDASFRRLSGEFAVERVVQREERRPLLDGGAVHEFARSVEESFEKLTTEIRRAADVFDLLLSFAFVGVFVQAFTYLRRYRRDIGFDNIYVTSYFRQIDASRRKAGKRFLLPLKPSERKTLIHPCSLRIHPAELQQVMSSGFKMASVALLSAVLLTVDFSLVHVLDIVSRHTVNQFHFNVSHRVDVRVDGSSMMARLLRKTVSAFNSSSSFQIHTDNQYCVSPPTSLPAGVYVSCVSWVLLVALLCCLQTYTNRLRRVIAAFYNPQREKKRIVFLYSLQIQRRTSSKSRKRPRRGQKIRTVFGCCQRQEASDSEVTHYAPS